MYFCLNLEKENKPQHFVGDRRLLAHPGEAVWHGRLRLWFLRFISSFAIYFSEWVFFLAVETVTETCVLRVCLITQVLENLGVCALVNVELQSHRPFCVPKDAHRERLFKGFFYIMPLKFMIFLPVFRSF